MINRQIDSDVTVSPLAVSVGFGSVNRHITIIDGQVRDDLNNCRQRMIMFPKRYATVETAFVVCAVGVFSERGFRQKLQAGNLLSQLRTVQLRV